MLLFLYDTLYRRHVIPSIKGPMNRPGMPSVTAP